MKTKVVTRAEFEEAGKEWPSVINRSTNGSYNPVDNSQQNPVSSVDESVNNSQNPKQETPVYFIGMEE